MSHETIKHSVDGLSPEVEAALTIASEIMTKIQHTLSGGRIRHVRIKLGHRTIKEIPVRTAALSAVLIAAAAVIVSQLSIEVDKD